jgi:hypothetical protein
LAAPASIFELTEANFQTYIDSAVTYHGGVAKSGAGFALSNHTIFDGSRTCLRWRPARRAIRILMRLATAPYSVRRRSLRNARAYLLGLK